MKRNPHVFRFVYLGVVDNLQLAEPKCGVETPSGLRITNDREILARITGRPEFQRRLGKHELTVLRRAEVFAHAEWTEDTGNAAPDPHETSKRVAALSAEAKNWLDALWIVRDSAASVRNVHALGRAPGWEPSASQVLRFEPSLADGSVASTTFTRDELFEAYAFGEYLARDLDAGESTRSLDTALARSGRIHRARHFVHSARHDALLMFKIASYCIALEALLGTRSDRLTHSLARRASCWLEKDATRRDALERDLKRAYEVRSRAVHGDRLAHEDHELQEISVLLDDITRRAMRSACQPEIEHLFFRGDSEPRFRAWLAEIERAQQ